MKRRQIIISGLGIVLFISVFLFAKFLAQNKAESVAVAPSMSEKMVKYLVVENSDVIPETSILGRLQAQDRIELYAEVSGRLLPSGNEFREGVAFKKGMILLQIDDEEARMNMLAQKSAFMQLLTTISADIKIDFPDRYEIWRQYIDGFSVEKNVADLPATGSQQEKFFLSNKQVFNQYFSLKASEARLEKYKIRAPFDGVVSASLIKEGTLVRVGQKLGEFLHPGVYEVEAAVSVGDLAYLSVNDRVSFSSNELEGVWQGRVERMSDQVDAATQTVKVFARLEGTALRDGLYVKGNILSKPIPKAMALRADLLVGENQLYIIVDGQLKLVEVEVIKSDQGRIIARGLTDGMYLLGAPLSRAYEGMPVSLEAL